MAEEEISEGGGGGKSKLIIIIVAVVILIAAGAAIFFLFFMGDEEEEVEEITEVSSFAEPLAEPQFLPLGTYIANLKDGRRYLKTSMTLMLSEVAAMEYLAIRLALIKDIVLAELQNMTVEDTKNPAQKNALKQKLITEINKLFPRKPEWEDPEPIKRVLFEEFYVQ
ncbi:MAG: flagellar basal body-associated FliL family protein [SAR324 cluster bacterium]|nr:flagellar basal body-associated FliL family protein [SAR324 cluster bacterium]